MSSEIGITVENRTLARQAVSHQLWQILNQCVAAAKQRSHIKFGTGDGDDIPAALALIDVSFPDEQHDNVSILGPLTTDHFMLISSLEVLTLKCNDFDESGALEAFAALATRLRELKFVDCGLTSVQGLQGRCEYLQRFDISGCDLVTSIEALEYRDFLEEVNVSFTGITSIEPLRTCPALAKVDLRACELLSSISALESHLKLQEVDASETAITSIEPLRTFPALAKVNISYCLELLSIDALADHQWLKEVDVSGLPIVSIEPLLTSCPALTKLNLNGCRRLSHVGLCLPASVEVIWNY